MSDNVERRFETDIHIYNMGGACSTVGERRVAEGIVVVRPDGKRQLGRHRNKWKDKVNEEFGNMTEWL